MKVRTDWEPHPGKVGVGMIVIGLLLFIPAVALAWVADQTGLPTGVTTAIGSVLGAAAGLGAIWISISRWG